MYKLRVAALALSAVISAGCGAPIAVNQLSPREAETVHHNFGLTTGEPSEFSNIVLRRYDLLDVFPGDPQAALSKLHVRATAGDALPDEIFALAELSYLHADDEGGRPHYLAAALYAYAFMFPGPGGARLDPIDPRRRMAADIYARALIGAFTDPDSQRLQLAAGVYDLPFGSVNVSFDPGVLQFGRGRFVDLHSASDFEITGLRNRYRKAGVGASLIAGMTAPKGSRLERYASRELRIPATLLLRVDAPHEALRETDLAASLEFRPFSSDQTVTIDGREIPVESEPSVALAMTLARSRFWEYEMGNFLGRALNVSHESKLQTTEPYRPGQIPVVFVHGTNSSPPRWADMINDLSNDPRIHERFTFWTFSYMSSRPIALSAAELRKQLTEAVDLIDPERRNECLREMVVMGHSQGGLLTKMTAVHSGDRFWRALSDQSFESVRMSDETRRVVRDAIFVEPLPFVHRVIFVATPHRGSFLAGPQIVRRLIARLVVLPVDVLKAGAELGAATVNARASTERAASLERVPTSIDNMSPGNRFIKTLAEIPIAPDVKAHSIIPVKGDGPVEDGDDGVVKYKSAHIDGVESELVVRSPHSVQSNPYAIEEARRILLEHLQQSSCDRSGSVGPEDVKSM